MSRNEYPRRLPKRINARESISDISSGMCCNEEMARQCADEYWKNRHTGTQFISDIFICILACCCSILISGIATFFILIIFSSILNTIITEQFAYILSTIIMLIISIPFWKKRYIIMKEKLYYEYDIYEWIYIPTSFFTFISILLVTILIFN